tara:strand:+ start:454 stop:810 length:357 start_codon:yes stop_codon:yes gene_type:complete
MLPGLCKSKNSPLKKETKIEGSKYDKGGVGKKPSTKIDVKMEEYKKLPIWKQAFTTPPNVNIGYAPGVGKIGKGAKKAMDIFNKTAPSRSKMIKQIEQSLKKKGYKIYPSKTTHGKGK